MMLLLILAAVANASVTVIVSVEAVADAKAKATAAAAIGALSMSLLGVVTILVITQQEGNTACQTYATHLHKLGDLLEAVPPQQGPYFGVVTTLAGNASGLITSLFSVL